ncbi:hypothetical protein JDM601_3474 [Mycolicibacter sinensis]|uniref:Uncharacterized protein n=1 Tax=Mycolicibacter sinensis (strain JDM601) TaxID=875328 RepID=F5Z0C9_MYCSD|nr:hypothetical protein JDM601_3474 [Mycolicibacter sinensis]
MPPCGSPPWGLLTAFPVHRWIGGRPENHYRTAAELLTVTSM